MSKAEYLIKIRLANAIENANKALLCEDVAYVYVDERIVSDFINHFEKLGFTVNYLDEGKVYLS